MYLAPCLIRAYTINITNISTFLIILHVLLYRRALPRSAHHHTAVQCTNYIVPATTIEITDS